VAGSAEALSAPPVRQAQRLPGPAGASYRPWTLAGRYRVEEVIGRGGMSTVYRALDEVLGRPVAVKVLLPALADSDPTHIQRFRREARAVAALAHPGVVKIYDTGVDGDRHFLVMEYLDGRSLADVLRDGRGLPPPEAVRIAARVAQALAAAHGAGILHRDVKPANVMLGPDEQVTVLDFGIARPLQEATLTQPASAMGTAAYMAPERVHGEPGDERSDIYALGCLIYAMLTGHPPFAASEPVAVLHQQVHAQPAPPGARISLALELLLMSMLAKDPAARPQTAAAVAGRLEGSAGGSGVSRTVPGAGAPRTAGGLLARHGGRPRWATPLALMAAVAALLVVLAVLASGGGGQAPRGANLSRHRATRSVRKPVIRTPSSATTPAAPITAPAAPAPAPKAKGPGGAGPPGHARPHGPRGGPGGHGGGPPGHGGGPAGDGGGPAGGGGGD